MKENYRRVSADFYEDLEDITSRGKAVDITFWNRGGKSKIHGQISQIFDRDKEPYLKMSSGLEIRLDQLLEVDGKVPKGDC